MNRRQRLLVLAPISLSLLLAAIVLAPYVATTIDEATAPEVTPSPALAGVNSVLVPIDINLLLGLSPGASASPPLVPLAAPIRVRVPSLGIDLPVLQPKAGETFPLCDVSEFLTSFGRPGGSGVTVLYAHARPGMFGPLLHTELVGGNFVGREILIDTADGLLYHYKVVKAYTHQLSFDLLGKAPLSDILLQTSETDSATGTKLMVLAAQTSVGPETGGPAPVAHPRLCH
jgi:hypothetical protein